MAAGGSRAGGNLQLVGLAVHRLQGQERDPEMGEEVHVPFPTHREKEGSL